MTVSKETWEYYRTAKLPAIERARGMELELSDRQWGMLELDVFPSANIWRYSRENSIVENNFYFLMSIVKPIELSYDLKNMNLSFNENKTWIIESIFDTNNVPDLMIHSSLYKPFNKWLDEQNFNYRLFLVKAHNVYSNVLNGFAIIFNNQDDYILTKMTWGYHG